MSALLQGVTTAQGISPISMTIGAGAPDHVHNGIPYELDRSVAAAATTPTHYHQGLGFDAEGRLCVVEGADPDYFGSGAAPFLLANAGRLCVQAAALDHVSSGVPYTATGRIATTGDAPPELIFTDTFQTNFVPWVDNSVPDGEVVWNAGELSMDLQNIDSGNPTADRSFVTELDATYKLEVTVSSSHTTNNTLLNIGTTLSGQELGVATFPRTLTPTLYTRNFTSTGVTTVYLRLTHGFAGGIDHIHTVTVYKL